MSKKRKKNAWISLVDKDYERTIAIPILRLIYSYNLIPSLYSICFKINQLSYPKSNYFNFNQIYRKDYKYLWHEISIIKYIMKYIFIIYLFGVINVIVLYYKISQTQDNLIRWFQGLIYFGTEGIYYTWDNNATR